MSTKEEVTEVIAIREPLDGQYDGKLYPVRCSNPECNKNSNSIVVGNARLLGHYQSGSHGEIRCPRCGFLNIIDVE